MMIMLMIGSLSNYDGNYYKNVRLEKWIRAASNFIALIPSPSIRQLLANFSKVESKRATVKFRK